MTASEIWFSDVVNCLDTRDLDFGRLYELMVDAATEVGSSEIFVSGQGAPAASRGCEQRTLEVDAFGGKLRMFAAFVGRRLIVEAGAPPDILYQGVGTKDDLEIAIRNARNGSAGVRFRSLRQGEG